MFIIDRNAQFVWVNNDLRQALIASRFESYEATLLKTFICQHLAGICNVNNSNIRSGRVASPSHHWNWPQLNMDPGNSWTRCSAGSCGEYFRVKDFPVGYCAETGVEIPETEAEVMDGILPEMPTETHPNQFQPSSNTGGTDDTQLIWALAQPSVPPSPDSVGGSAESNIDPPSAWGDIDVVDVPDNFINAMWERTIPLLGEPTLTEHGLMSTAFSSSSTCDTFNSSLLNQFGAQGPNANIEESLTAIHTHGLEIEDYTSHWPITTVSPQALEKAPLTTTGTHFEANNQCLVPMGSRSPGSYDFAGPGTQNREYVPNRTSPHHLDLIYHGTEEPEIVPSSRVLTPHKSPPRKLQPTLRPKIPGQDSQTGQSTTVSNDRLQKDDYLVKSRLAGMTYKEIREKGGFEEAESTLRGRFRTLTKHREARVRKPEWKSADIKLLEEAVDELVGRQNLAERKIPWKKVADYISDKGGYHFGNATCRKKWDELRGTEQNE